MNPVFTLGGGDFVRGDGECFLIRSTNSINSIDKFDVAPISATIINNPPNNNAVTDSIASSEKIIVRERIVTRKIYLAKKRNAFENKASTMIAKRAKTVNANFSPLNLAEFKPIRQTAPNISNENSREGQTDKTQNDKTNPK